MKTIHKGRKYTIAVVQDADGALRAVKTAPGEEERKMEYFPERDVAPLAGEIDERTAWMLLADVARDLGKYRTPVCPEHILIDSKGRFLLSGWSESVDPAFSAPEGCEPVWALGATLFYLVLGCPVFSGLGGAVQGPSTPVPTLRRAWPELSSLVGRCLAFNPSDRPSVKEIYETATRFSIRLSEMTQELKRPLKDRSGDVPEDELDAVWPEKFS